MKKLISFILISVLCCGLNASVFADTHEDITENTVVTADNVYAVVDYLGLEANSVVKKNLLPSEYKTFTVAELKLLIERAKQSPSHVKTNIVSIPDSTVFQQSRTITGTKTVYSNDDTLGVTYSATATYYSVANIKYWDTALGSTITANSTHLPSFKEVDAIHRNDVSVVNPQASTSYINIDYDYDLGEYLGIDGGIAVRINQVNVTGSVRFWGKDYL